MVTFVYLTSGAIGEVLERNYDDAEGAKHFHHVCTVPAVLTSISSAFFVFFAMQEITVMADTSFTSYYSDIWNWIDSITLMLNFIFLSVITFS